MLGDAIASKNCDVSGPVSYVYPNNVFSSSVSCITASAKQQLFFIHESTFSYNPVRSFLVKIMLFGKAFCGCQETAGNLWTGFPIWHLKTNLLTHLDVQYCSTYHLLCGQKRASQGSFSVISVILCSFNLWLGLKEKILNKNFKQSKIFSTHYPFLGLLQLPE